MRQQLCPYGKAEKNDRKLDRLALDGTGVEIA